MPSNGMVEYKYEKCQIPYCRGQAKFKPWFNDIEKKHCKKHAEELREKEAEDLILERKINERDFII